MAYRVTRSFVSRQHGGAYVQGDKLKSLPDGVDWVKARLVVEIEDEDPKPAARRGRPPKK